MPLFSFHPPTPPSPSHARYEDATCLVSTGVGKWYSLGLDLEWMGSQSVMELLQFSNDIQKLLARLITFPLVTVAALNGEGQGQPRLLLIN